MKKGLIELHDFEVTSTITISAENIEEAEKRVYNGDQEIASELLRNAEIQKGPEDGDRLVRCTNCNWKGREGELYSLAEDNHDKEYCPKCNETGTIMDV